MTLNLNEPSKIEDTSWIKPVKYVVWWEMITGKSSWSYTNDYLLFNLAWTIQKNRMVPWRNYKNVKIFDFAEHGFGGVLVEGWKDGRLVWSF
jgi:hypothetical protein